MLLSYKKRFLKSIVLIVSMVNTEFDLILIEPHIVAPLFQVGIDQADELLVGIMAVAEKDPQAFNDILNYFYQFWWKFFKKRKSEDFRKINIPHPQ